MSTPAISLARRPSRAPLRDVRRRLGWFVLVPAACLATAASAVAAPVVFVGSIAALAAAAAFTVEPVAVLLGIVLIRPSLDTSGSIFQVGGVNAAGVLGVLIVVGGGFALLQRRDRPRTTFTLVFATFLAVALISLAWSPAPAEGFRTWITLLAPFVMFVFAATVVREEALFRRVITFTLASAAVPIGVALVQLATGNLVDKADGGFLSVQSTFVHPNGFALYLLVVLSLALVTFFEARRPAEKALAAGLVAVGAPLMMLTFARAAWVGLALVFVVLALTHYRRLVPAGLLVALAILVATPSVVDTLTERFADLSTSYEASSLDWRTEQWDRMLPYGSDHALTGNGLGSYLPLSNREFGAYDWNFQAAGRAKGDVEIYAHNDYVHFFVELGAPGALLWGLTLVALVALLTRLRRVAALRPYAIAMTTVVVALALIGLTENVHGHPAVLILVMAVAGAMLGVARGPRPARGPAR